MTVSILPPIAIKPVTGSCFVVTVVATVAGIIIPVHCSNESNCFVVICDGLTLAARTCLVGLNMKALIITNALKKINMLV